jgi:hypothetical protein
MEGVSAVIKVIVAAARVDAVAVRTVRRMWRVGTRLGCRDANGADYEHGNQRCQYWQALARPPAGATTAPPRTASRRHRGILAGWATSVHGENQ